YKPRLVVAGSSLMQRSSTRFQYRSEFDCADEKELRGLLKFADEALAPEVARNIERYLSHKIEIPKIDPTPNPNDLADPNIPKKEVPRGEAAIRDQSVDVKIDLLLDNVAVGRIQMLTGLFAMAARAEVDVVADPRGRHLLGKAAVQLAQQGDASRKIA